jgi:hypothetical protein
MPVSRSAEARGRPLRALWGAAPAVLLSVVLLALVSPARADEQPGFVIRTAYSELINGVYYLDADVGLNLSDDAVNALQNGLPLTVELDIQVIKHHSWWLDKNVADLKQRYQLSYHELSRRFIVVNLNSGDQESYSSYSEAIVALGQVSDLPVIDAKLLDPGAHYNIRLRAGLDIKTFPGPLQLIASLFKGWDLSSDWYQWVLVS